MKFLPIPLSPDLPIYSFFREGIEDHAGGHTEKTDEKGEMISLCRVRRSRPRKRFDHPSKKGHEDSCSSHGEEIDVGHHCPRYRNGKGISGVSIDQHPKAMEETDKEEDETE